MEFVTNVVGYREESLRLNGAAKGGVLFIDEAYELGKGPFGAEACTAIVAAMTDPKYRGPAAVAAWPMVEGFAALLPLDGWGNARDVDKVWKASLQQRADRVVEDPEGQVAQLKLAALAPDVNLPSNSADLRTFAQDVKEAQAKSMECSAEPSAVDERDPGVSDEIWAELQREKEEPRLCFIAILNLHKAVAQEEARLLREQQLIEDCYASLGSVASCKELRREMEAYLKRLAEEEEQAPSGHPAGDSVTSYLQQIPLDMSRNVSEDVSRSAAGDSDVKEIERLRAEEAKRQAIQKKLQQISPCISKEADGDVAADHTLSAPVHFQHFRWTVCRPEDLVKLFTKNDGVAVLVHPMVVGPLPLRVRLCGAAKHGDSAGSSMPTCAGIAEIFLNADMPNSVNNVHREAAMFWKSFQDLRDENGTVDRQEKVVTANGHQSLRWVLRFKPVAIGWITTPEDKEVLVQQPIQPHAEPLLGCTAFGFFSGTCVHASSIFTPVLASGCFVIGSDVFMLVEPLKLWLRLPETMLELRCAVCVTALIGCLHLVAGQSCTRNPRNTRRKLINAYGEEIPLGIVMPTWPSGEVIGSIARLVIEEHFGYETQIYSTGSVRNALLAVAGLNEPESWNLAGCSDGKTQFHVAPDMWLEEWPATWLELEWSGPFAPVRIKEMYLGGSGMYVTKAVWEQKTTAPSLDTKEGLEQSENPAQYFDDISTFDSMLPCEATILMTPAYMTKYVEVTGDSAGVNADGFGVCTMGAWWVAPACRPNTSDCVPLVTGGFGGGGGGGTGAGAGAGDGAGDGGGGDVLIAVAFQWRCLAIGSGRCGADT
eukprot:Skav216724  [mRNA]  locus=scaffold653:65985:76190:+ [translate_table: standard]